MAVEVFANSPVTNVTSGGTTAPAAGTQETWTVSSASSFPSASTGLTWFHIADTALPSELITVINTSGDTWTVLRGAEGTSTVAHVNPFTIYQVVTAGALKSLYTLDWLNVVTMFGADPTGSADSTTAIQNAVNALPVANAASGGVLYFPQGIYKVSSTITIPVAGVYLIGDGIWNSIIKYYGSGDCIRMYSSIGYGNGAYTSGGGIEDILIDGTNASAGACGIHAGDIYQLQWNTGARFFQGSGSKGIWFDNQYFYTEDMHGHLFVEQNTSNLVFDNSANVSGTATGSFARTLLDVVVDAKGVGTGVILRNGAEIYDSKLGIYGNMDYGTSQFYCLNITGQPGYSFTATNASPCVFTASGSYYSNGTFVNLSGGSLPAGFSAQGYYVVNASGSSFGLSATSGGTAINSTSTGSGTVQGPYSKIFASQLNIGMECNAQSGTQPVTINFGSQGNNQIRDCYGVIDFTGNNAFAYAVNSSGSFQFDGPVLGDALLFRVVGSGQVAYAAGAISNGALIPTRYNGMTTAAPTGNVTGCMLQTNDPGTGGGSGGDWANAYFTLVNSGTGSITFASSGTSHVATGTSCVVPAGSSMTFAWISNNSLWYPLSLADFTASDIQPDGIQTAGSIGKWADAGHVHQNNADLSLYLAPSGATGETFPRGTAVGYTGVMTSEQTYASAIPLPANLIINNLAVMNGNTAPSGVTHGWLALTDSSRIVRAVTADQTSTFGAAFSVNSLAVAATYTIPTSGLYYLMVNITASTMGNISLGNFPLSAPNGTPPILAGTSSSSLTTPPATGSTLGTIGANGIWRFYGYTS